MIATRTYVCGVEKHDRRWAFVRKRFADACCAPCHQSQHVAKMRGARLLPRTVGSPEKGPGRTQQTPMGNPYMRTQWLQTFEHRAKLMRALPGGAQPSSTGRPQWTSSFGAIKL